MQDTKKGSGGCGSVRCGKVVDTCHASRFAVLVAVIAAAVLLLLLLLTIV